MRAGALSDANVGRYLKEHFVSTWKRVSTFTAIQRNGVTVARQGGNVAVYFCTPEQEVIHAVARPVGKERFLAEAKWAVETWKAAREKSGGDREALRKMIREAHLEAGQAQRTGASGRAGTAQYGSLQTFELNECLIPYDGALELLGELRGVPQVLFGQDPPKPNELPKVEDKKCDPAEAKPRSAPDTTVLQRVLPSQPGTVLNRSSTALILGGSGGRNMHRYLAEQGLPKLDDVYRHVFEGMLGQRVTDQPVRTREAATAKTQLHVQYAATPAEDMAAKIRELQKQVEDLKKQIEELKAKEKRPTY